MYMVSRFGMNFLIPLSKYSSIPGKLKKKSFSPVINIDGATTIGAFGSWFGGAILSNNDLQGLTNLRTTWKQMSKRSKRILFLLI